MHTASYCASRVCHVVGSSRSDVLPKIRWAAWRPSSRLVAVGAKKTTTYPCGLVSGAPGDANGAPHPDPSAYAKKFSGKYSHRLVNGGIGHNLPQEAPRAFADAVIDVDRL